MYLWSTHAQEPASANKFCGLGQRKDDMTYLLYPFAIIFMITGSAMQFL